MRCTHMLVGWPSPISYIEDIRLRFHAVLHLAPICILSSMFLIHVRFTDGSIYTPIRLLGLPGVISGPRGWATAHIDP